LFFAILIAKFRENAGKGFKISKSGSEGTNLIRLYVK